MPQFKRLFIGLDLPDSCKEVIEGLDPGLRGLRWVQSRHLHLTLSFLGDIGEDHETDLRATLSLVRVPPFFLPLQGAGFFKSRGQPSVVWIGVGKGHPHLFALHHHIQDAVLKAHLEPDLKPFHPHITVGRCRGVSSQALRPWVLRNESAEFGLIHVTEFVLFSSVLTPEGPIYDRELRVPLVEAPSKHPSPPPP